MVQDQDDDSDSDDTGTTGSYPYGFAGHTTPPGQSATPAVTEVDDDPDDESDDTEGPDPTHECARCRSYTTHIESSPTRDYQWCPECERVQPFDTLDTTSNSNT